MAAASIVDPPARNHRDRLDLPARPGFSLTVIPDTRRLMRQRSPSRHAHDSHGDACHSDHVGHRASSSAAAAEEPLVEKYLLEGKLADGEKALADAIAAKPTDAQARFGLGVIQFVGAVERMVQTFHRYGLRAGVVGNMLPFARLPDPRQSRARADPLRRSARPLRAMDRRPRQGRGDARQGRFTRTSSCRSTSA